MLHKDKIKEEFEKFLFSRQSRGLFTNDEILAHLSAQYEKLIEEVIGEDEISTCDDEKASVAWCNCKEVIERNALRLSIRTSLQERGIIIK